MPDTQNQNRSTAINTLYDRLADIELKIDKLTVKVDGQQGMLDRIYKVLDAAFSRFGDVLKSPFLQTVFTNMGQKPKEIPPDVTSKKT